MDGGELSSSNANSSETTVSDLIGLDFSTTSCSTAAAASSSSSPICPQLLLADEKPPQEEEETTDAASQYYDEEKPIGKEDHAEKVEQCHEVVSSVVAAAPAIQEQNKRPSQKKIIFEAD